MQREKLPRERCIHAVGKEDYSDAKDRTIPVAEEILPVAVVTPTPTPVADEIPEEIPAETHEVARIPEEEIPEVENPEEITETTRFSVPVVFTARDVSISGRARPTDWSGFPLAERCE